MREQTSFRQNALFVELLTNIQIKKKKTRKEKVKARAAADSDRQQAGCTPHKCFICGSVDHLIDKYLKTPKENKKYERTSVSMKGVIMH